MPVNTISASQVSYTNGQRQIATYQPAAHHNRNNERKRPQQLIGPTGWRCRARQREPRLDLVISGQAVAVDCEGQNLPEEKANHGGVGVYVNGLGRVSVVREDGALIYDTFAFYPRGVPTSRSPTRLKLGVSNADVLEKNGAQPLHKVLGDLRAIFDKSGLIVGHDMENEMRYMRGLDEKILDVPIAGVTWSQYTVRDTQEFSEYYFAGRKSGLAKLSSRVLDLTVQSGSHDSIEDAKATMALYMRRKSEIDAEQINLRFNPFRTGFVSTFVPVGSLDLGNLYLAEEKDGDISSLSEAVTTPEVTESSQSSLTLVTPVVKNRSVACGTKVALPCILSHARGRQFNWKTSMWVAK